MSDSKCEIIPAVLPASIVPQLYEISEQKCGERSRFTYSISWDQPVRGCKVSASSTSIASRRAAAGADGSLSRIMAGADGSDEEVSAKIPRDRDIVVQPAKPVGSHTMIAGEMMCAGPCKQSYSPSKLQTVPKCGHKLCNNCVGIVANIDGSEACSSFTCTHKNFYEYLPTNVAKVVYENVIVGRYIERVSVKKTRIDPSRSRSRTNLAKKEKPRVASEHKSPPRPILAVRSRSHSSLADVRIQEVQKFEDEGSKYERVDVFNGENIKPEAALKVMTSSELVQITIQLVQHDEENNVVKKYVSDEFSGSTPLKTALQSLLGKGWDSKKSHKLLKVVGQQMVRVKPDEYNKMQLRDYKVQSGELFFVVDQVNHIKKKSFTKAH